MSELAAVIPITRGTPPEELLFAVYPGSSPVIAYLGTLRTPNSHRAALGALRVAYRALCPQWERPTRQILELLSWHLLRPDHIGKMLATMSAQGIASRTIELSWYTLRAVLRTAHRMGRFPDWCMTELEGLQLPSRVGLNRRRHRPLAIGTPDPKRLPSLCDPQTPVGARDLAILALLDGLGLRRPEAERVGMDDLAPEWTRLRVIRRGEPEWLPLSDPVRQAIVHWLRWRGTAQGPLILSVSARGHLILKPFKSWSMLRVYRRLVTEAGVASPACPERLEQLRAIAHDRYGFQPPHGAP